MALSADTAPAARQPLAARLRLPRRLTTVCARPKADERPCGVLPAPSSHSYAARTRPATTRTPLGAARQIANADSTEQPIATQNASV